MASLTEQPSLIGQLTRANMIVAHKAREYQIGVKTGIASIQGISEIAFQRSIDFKGRRFPQSI